MANQIINKSKLTQSSFIVFDKINDKARFNLYKKIINLKPSINQNVNYFYDQGISSNKNYSKIIDNKKSPNKSCVKRAKSGNLKTCKFTKEKLASRVKSKSQIFNEAHSKKSNPKSNSLEISCFINPNQNEIYKAFIKSIKKEKTKNFSPIKPEILVPEEIFSKVKNAYPKSIELSTQLNTIMEESKNSHLEDMSIPLFLIKNWQNVKESGILVESILDQIKIILENYINMYHIQQNFTFNCNNSNFNLNSSNMKYKEELDKLREENRRLNQIINDKNEESKNKFIVYKNEIGRLEDSTKDLEYKLIQVEEISQNLIVENKELKEKLETSILKLKEADNNEHHNEKLKIKERICRINNLSNFEKSISQNMASKTSSSTIEAGKNKVLIPKLDISKVYFNENNEYLNKGKRKSSAINSSSSFNSKSNSSQEITEKTDNNSKIESQSNINKCKIPLDKIKNIQGFQDEFYSKINEFSESWRSQALKEKRF